MNKVTKIVIRLSLVAIVLVAATLLYFSWRWDKTYPDTSYPAISASVEPGAVERGRYLVHAVAHCSGCHAPRDSLAAFEAGTDPVMRGGELPMGPIGTLRPPNLTSDRDTGIGQHTDAELARAIRHGVRRDGRVAPLMIGAGPVADADLADMLAYLRSLPPVASDGLASEVSILGKVLLQTALAEVGDVHPVFPIPPYAEAGDVSVERGRYLAEGPGACFGCHSHDVERDYVPAEFFCGNPDPWPDAAAPDNSIYAPNLTTHPTAGKLAGLSADDFVARMRAPRMYAGSPMAWENLAQMTDEDLLSIFAYLSQREPCDRDIGPTYVEG